MHTPDPIESSHRPYPRRLLAFAGHASERARGGVVASGRPPEYSGPCRGKCYYLGDGIWCDHNAEPSLAKDAKCP
jgi:hypothetical protein